MNQSFQNPDSSDSKPQTKKPESNGPTLNFYGKKMHFGFVPRLPKKTLFLLLAALALALVAIAVGIFVFVIGNKKDVPVSNPAAEAYRKQLPALAEKVDKNPNDANAHQDYAVALYATGDLTKARDQYLEKIKLANTDATAYNNLGNVYRDLKDYDKAVEAYKKAISINSHYATPYINMANLQIYTLKKPEDGIATYLAARKAVPDDQNIQVLLALAYENTGDLTKAKQTLSELLASHPENSTAKSNLDRLNSQ